MDWLIDHLAVIMFVALVFIMFLGYPVAFLLGAIGIGFGLLGIVFDVFSMNQFANLLPRIYGQAVQNQVLVAIPMFVFMGTMLEKSGVAEDLLKILQLMLRRVPGGLAIAGIRQPGDAAGSRRRHRSGGAESRGHHPPRAGFAEVAGGDPAADPAARGGVLRVLPPPRARARGCGEVAAQVGGMA